MQPTSMGLIVVFDPLKFVSLFNLWRHERNAEYDRSFWVQYAL